MLAENYVKPNERYLNIQRIDGFVQDAMPYKPLNRAEVRSRDLILDDGQAYDQYYDPMLLTARNMLKDIEAYNVNVGSTVEDNSSLKVNIQGLA